MIDVFSILDPNERLVVRRVPGRGTCVFVRRWVEGRGELETIVVLDDSEGGRARPPDPTAEKIRQALFRVRSLASEGPEE